MTDLSDMSTWDKPIFPVAVASQAALVAPGTMRMWFVRKRITLDAGAYDPGLEADKAGLPRLLSFRTVLTIAAAARLVNKGVDVSDAYEAAKEWTWYSEGWNGEGECPREPACLFAQGFTFLVHYAGAQARVINGNPNPNFSDLFVQGGPVRTSPTLVFLNDIDRYARGVCGGFLRDE